MLLQNVSNIKNEKLLGLLRIKLGAAEQEVKMQSLCYAAPEVYSHKIISACTKCLRQIVMAAKRTSVRLG